MSAINNQWITIVLITAVLMLVFLVFFGNKAPMTPVPAPVSQQNPINEVKTEEPASKTAP